jgi:hypothetical protein
LAWRQIDPRRLAPGLCRSIEQDRVEWATAVSPCASFAQQNAGVVKQEGAAI